MANSPNNQSQPKKRGILFNWLKNLFFIIPILLILKTTTHTIVQFPENRSKALCLETYWIIEFYWVDVLSIFFINNPAATVERSTDALDWKINCNDSDGFGITRLIPNIPKLNMRDEENEWN
jgi:hypothetical protein